jgi:hypothetical protein
VNARSEEFDKAVLALKTGDYSGLIITKEGPFVVHVETQDREYGRFCQGQSQTGRDP